jgi:hypothetical protein
MIFTIVINISLFVVPYVLINFQRFLLLGLWADVGLGGSRVGVLTLLLLFAQFWNWHTLQFYWWPIQLTYSLSCANCKRCFRYLL